MSHLIYCELLGSIKFSTLYGVPFEEEADFIAACKEVLVPDVFPGHRRVITQGN